MNVTPTPDYSAISVEVPLHYPKAHSREMDALKARFPNLDIWECSVNKVRVSADMISDGSREVHNWVESHMPAH